jgi:hypothetical protein
MVRLADFKIEKEDAVFVKLVLCYFIKTRSGNNTDN